MAGEEFGDIEWTVFMGMAFIPFKQNPKVALVLRPIDRKNKWSGTLSAALGTSGPVKAEALKGVLPPYSEIKWKDAPVGMSLATVELIGEADGLRISLMTNLDRPIKNDDPQAIAEFKKLQEMAESILKASLR